MALGDSHGLHLLDPLTGEEIARWEAPAYHLTGKLFLTLDGLSATALAYSPGGALLAAVSQAGLHVVHGERSRVLWEAPGIRALAFSPAGDRIAALTGELVRVFGIEP